MKLQDTIAKAKTTQSSTKWNTLIQTGKRNIMTNIGRMTHTMSNVQLDSIEELIARDIKELEVEVAMESNKDRQKEMAKELDEFKKLPQQKKLELAGYKSTEDYKRVCLAYDTQQAKKNEVAVNIPANGISDNFVNSNMNARMDYVGAANTVKYSGVSKSNTKNVSNSYIEQQTKNSITCWKMVGAKYTIGFNKEKGGAFIQSDYTVNNKDTNVYRIVHNERQQTKANGPFDYVGLTEKEVNNIINSKATWSQLKECYNFVRQGCNEGHQAFVNLNGAPTIVF